MWMNVLKALITVILLQLAMTFKGAIVALANLDTREMDFLAQVSTCVFLAAKLYYFSNCVHVVTTGYQFTYTNQF